MNRQLRSSRRVSRPLRSRRSRRVRVGLDLPLEPRLVLDGRPLGVMISEFMASNRNGLRDQDGDHSDWIEIHNPTAQTVDLTGWSLTDDPSKPGKWTFPITSITAGGFLVVFASDKNRAVPDAELHTNFKISASGGYLALDRPDGTVADAYASYPTQYADVSYGHPFATTALIGEGATATYQVPTDGSLGGTWVSETFQPDSSWSQGPTGLGYGVLQSGFTVHYVKANVDLNDLNAAKTMLDTPSQQDYTADATAGVINYLDTGDAGNYPNDNPFPLQGIGDDVDRFAIDARGLIRIPTAGKWTFGVNSDDGFELVLERNGRTFRLSYDWLRGANDTLATFDIPEAGDWNVRLITFENQGGASAEFFAAPGLHPNFDGSFRLVGDTANGGLAVFSPLKDDDLTGTDVRDEMQGKNATAFVRIPFDVSDFSTFDSLTLRMRYDDGFVAYLNGVRVASRNAPAALSFSSASQGARTGSELLIPELISLTNRMGLLHLGTNVLAIQALNASAGDDDFLLLPELLGTRVDTSQAGLFKTPTPGDFNADAYLGVVGDVNFSVGRGFYDAPFTVTLTTPTAGAAVYYTLDGSLPTPENGTLYTGPIDVTGTTVLRAGAFLDEYISSGVGSNTYLFLDDVIQQSPDGSAPAGWPTSWGNNTVDYGMDPAIVDDPRFGGDGLKDALKSIPTISITTDLANLFSSASGIYANPYGKGDFWERAASIELINPDGTTGFQIDAGLRIRGGYSRDYSNPKHAFRLFFNNDYDGALSFPLFGDEGVKEFAKVDLRTDQNYSWSFGGDPSHTAVRDVFSRDTMRDMGEAYTRSRYYQLYIDGQYWGMFQSEERPEANYAASYYGGDPDDYDVVKVENYAYDVYATDGNLDAWRELYDAASAGFATNEAYYRVQGKNPDGTVNPAYKNLVEIDNLISYMETILFTGNLDAPVSAFLGNQRPNNFYAFRNRNGTEGFRFVAHDSEHTLFNPYEDRNGPYPAGENFETFNPQFLHQKLMENPEYRLRFADHVRKDFFNDGVLTPEKNQERFQARAAEIIQAILGESARWGDSKTEPPRTPDDWQAAIDYVVNSYFPIRTDIVLGQFRANGLYPMVEAATFLVDGVENHGGRVEVGAKLRLNAPSGTIYYTLDGSDPRLIGGGISPSALVFDPSTSPDLTLDQTAKLKVRVFDGTDWSALDSADFLVNEPATADNLLVTELNYNPYAPDASKGEPDVDKEDFEFIELKNVGATEIDLTGVKFTTGITFDFTGSSAVYVAPGAYVVVVKNIDAFRARYGDGPVIAGVYSGSLSNSGERIRLVDAAGNDVMDFTYDDEGDWPTDPDGRGKSLVLVAPNGDPNDPSSWRASAEQGGSPGAQGNTAPDLTAPGNRTTDEDTPVTGLAITVADAETAADAIELIASSDNSALIPAAGLVLTGSGGSRTLAITPALNQFGRAKITVTARDGKGGETSRSFVLTVNPVNDAPESTADAYTTNENTTLVVGAADGLLANDRDVDDDALTVVAVSTPAHGVVTWSGDGSFTYVPVTNFHGVDTFTYRISDGQVEGPTTTVTITVNAANVAPTLGVTPPQHVQEGSLLQFQVSATDDATPADRLRYSLGSDAPAGMTIDPSTGLVSWTPAAGPLDLSVTVIATDNGTPALSASATVAIHVVNVAPVVDAGGDRQATAGSAFSAVGAFNDPGADAWTVTVDYGDGSPASALALNPDKSFRLDHVFAASGVYTVSVRVADGDAEGLATFQVTVAGGGSGGGGETPPPPILVGIQAAIRRNAATALRLIFSEPLDPARARDLAAYRLVFVGRDGLPGTPDDVGVALRSVRLSPSGTGLILTPRRLLPLGVRYQLTVAGDSPTGLTNRAGTLLDGDRDGLAGGDSVNPFTIRRRGGVQPFAQAVPNASTARRLQAARFGRFASPARFV